MKNRSVRLSSALLALFLLGAPGASASPSAPPPTAWAGLWRIAQDTEVGPVTLFLHLRKGAPRPMFYDSSWQSLRVSDWRFEESKGYWNVQIRGRNVVFEGPREGERLKGDWKMVHPQYEVTRGYTAERVIDRADWQPLAGPNRVETADRLVDLTRLLEEAAAGDLESFLRTWREEIEPDQYVLLRFAPKPEELYRTLKREDFLERAERFRRTLAAVRREFRRQLPAYPFRDRVVGAPFGDPQRRILRVGDQLFLNFDVTRADYSPESARDRYRLAQELIRLCMQAVYPDLPHPAVRVFLKGLPLYYSSRLGFSNDPTDYFNIPEDRLEEIRSALDEHRKSAAAQDWEAPEDVLQVLGFHFVQVLAQRFPEDEVLLMEPHRVNTEFRAWTGR